MKRHDRRLRAVQVCTQAIDGQIYELSRNDRYFGESRIWTRSRCFRSRARSSAPQRCKAGGSDGCFFFANEAVLETLAQAADDERVPRGRRRLSSTCIPNIKAKPFDDIRVRRGAVARHRPRGLHQDRRTACRRVLSQHRPADARQFVQPEHSDEIKQFAGYDTMPGAGGNIEANRKRAMRLLEQAGVTKALRLSLLARGDLPAFRNSSINVAAQLKTIGLDATVDVRDTGGSTRHGDQRQFQLVAHSVGHGRIGARSDFRRGLHQLSAAATMATGRTTRSTTCFANSRRGRSAEAHRTHQEIPVGVLEDLLPGQPGLGRLWRAHT